MQLVDQTLAQVLPDRRGAAADPHVLAAGRLARTLERFMNAARHEVERRAALHRERRARVVRQHERVAVIRRLVAPPPSPALVGPLAAHGAEHVAPENPCADVREAALRELVVDTRRAAFLTEHLAKRARARTSTDAASLTADAERLLQALARAGAVPVERDA